jgi:murein DD-endopeptidase MepM/ murein hydrolase activator NlpD
MHVVGQRGNNVQIIYRLDAGGHRMGWIPRSELNTGGGQPANTTGWQFPIDGAYSTWRSPGSQMSWGVDNPSSSRSDRPTHVGIDIAGSNSTIRAAASGVVAETGWNGANGNFVIISHRVDGRVVYSFYAHLSSASVRKNQEVNRGDAIGIIGNTGSSTDAIHLHFAITDTLRSNGDYVGYAPRFSGNRVTHNGVTFYNPVFVIQNNRLP